MTWKEFKDEVEKQGVTDDMEVHYIDIGFGDAAYLNIEIDKEDNDFTVT
jgi:hypothetical protein